MCSPIRQIPIVQYPLDNSIIEFLLRTCYILHDITLNTWQLVLEAKRVESFIFQIVLVAFLDKLIKKQLVNNSMDHNALKINYEMHSLTTVSIWNYYLGRLLMNIKSCLVKDYL